MRMRRSRVQKFFLKKREVKKDSEGSTYDEYKEAVAFQGEAWAASGKVQAEQYGEKLSYIRNVRVDGKYSIKTDEKGVPHYAYPDGLDIVESDGVCLYVGADMEPDYKVLSINPVRPLRMECIKI